MLKPGDKVICIYNTVLDHLTYGKEYIVYKETTDDIVCIYNDNLRYSTYSRNRFMTLKDFRKEKILKIQRSSVE